MNGKQLKNSILQWAIQGKLVPQDPNDEPASVLLEKIRTEKARLVKEGKIKKDKKESIIYRGEDNSYYEKFADGKVVCIDDEIPFEIPQGWEWCRISHLFLHTSGKQQSYTNKDKGIPQRFITTSNLYWGRFVLDNLKVMNFTKEETETCSATKGDLLVCEGGAGYGRSAIWDKDYDICLQNHIHRLRPYIDGICEYIYYFIYFLKESNQLASVGTAMPGLSANRLKRLLLPLPPYKEQKYIVDKLTTILSLVDSYGDKEKILSQLNVNLLIRLRKSILQEAIQGKLIPQDPNDEPASVLLQRIKEEKQRLVKEGKLKKKDIVDSIIYKGDDNKYYEQIGRDTIEISNEILFDLPCSWQWVRFGQIVRMSIGKTPARGEVSYWSKATIPWVSISDMTNSEHINKTKEKISVAASSVMGEISPVGSLLMSFKLTVGRTSILNIDAYHNEAIISIYPFIDDKYALRDYLFYTLPFLSNMGDSKDAIKGKTLNSKSLKSLLIPLPPLREQRCIINRLEELYAHL